MWFVILFIQIALIKSLSGKGMPNYLHSCSRNDPNLNACALQIARESIYQFSLGDKSRNMEPLDPLYVPEMIVYLPNENGIKVVFKENNFTGLSGMQMNDLRFDLERKHITADALVNLNVDCFYDLSGKIFVVPVTSNGDASIKLKNTALRIRFWYEHVIGNDGKIYWNIIRHDIKYEVERAMFRLENLMNDINIGDQINKLLNDMWREIVSEVGPAIAQVLGQAVVGNLGVLLSQIPYEELIPDV